MSIDTRRVHSEPFAFKHNLRSRVTFSDILADFKSLEEIASSLEDISTGGMEEVAKNDYSNAGLHLQLQNFRRPKWQENEICNNDFIKLNRPCTTHNFKGSGAQ